MELNFKIQNDSLIAGSILQGKSGNVGTYVCKFDILDNKDFLWFGVFKKGDSAYQQVIEDGRCIVPKEVLENSGNVEIGCYGTNGDMRISTNWLIFSVKDGAYCDATAPEEPTPDVWEVLVMNTVPYIGETGNWYVYDKEKKEYVDSGKPSNGEKEKNWELLQGKDITEEDGEIDGLTITFPEGYREFVITIDKKGYATTNNTTIYPAATKDDGQTTNTPFWDFYEGEKSVYISLSFSSMMLNGNNAIKMEGFCQNVSAIGKAKNLITSGWIDGYKGWKGVRFSTILPVGSKFRVWGSK